MQGAQVGAVRASLCRGEPAGAGRASLCRARDVGGVHKACPRNSSWIVSRPSDTNALFMTDDERARIQLINLHAPGRESAVLELPEQHRVLNISRAGIRTLNDAYSSSLRDYAMTTLAPALGVPLTLFSANTVINIHGACGEDDARLRPDYDFLGPLRACGFTDDVVAVGENAFWLWNRETGLWGERTLANAAGVLRAYVSRGDVPGLEPPEAAYLKRCNGALNVVRAILNELYRPGFLERLDDSLEPGCVPFCNGLYDARTDELRTFKRDDFVSQTTGYAYAPPEPDDDACLDAFLASVLPDAAERAYFVRMMALAFFGTGKIKYYLMLVDDAGGSNGKTTLMRLVEHVFGRFKAPAERSFLHVDTGNNTNGAAANLLAYRNKRLAFFDEPDKDKKLDVRRLKDLCSGASVQRGRQLHCRDVEEFDWRCLIVIACNESSIPTLDAADEPFIKRTKVLRMRSLFLRREELRERAEDEGWDPDALGRTLFEASDEDFMDTLKARCRMALVKALASAYREARAQRDAGACESLLGPDPPELEAVRAEVLRVADARLDLVSTWLDRAVDFAPVRNPERDRGKHYFAFIPAADMLVRLMADLNLGGRAKSQWKALLAQAMASRGRSCRLLRPISDDTKKAYKVIGYDRVCWLTR